MNRMLSIREFFRWRSAPPEQRDAIASHQLLAFETRELFPATFDPESIAPNGVAWKDCALADFAEFAEWMRSVYRAATRLDVALRIAAHGSGRIH
jgi:hypothetical protein